METVAFEVEYAAQRNEAERVVHMEKRIKALEAALKAIFDAADAAVDEADWGDRVSAAMTDDARALVAQWPQG